MTTVADKPTYEELEQRVRELEKADSERRQAQSALRISHERFLSVLNSIDATVYVADMETFEILFMNKYMIESFGRDMTGETCWDAFRKEPGRCPYCTNPQLIDENGNLTGVVVWQDQNPVNGKWYINHDRAIEWIDGRIVRLQIATDITDLKKMEERVRQSQKMESIGNLAGGIAHDFNNILFPIVGMAELLLEDLPPDSPERESVMEIIKAGRRGSELVKQILAFSRRTGQRKIPVRMQQIVKEALVLARSTIPSDIEISRQIQHDCGLVMADPTQVHQIVMNLITNAFHAVEPSGGAIHVELKQVELAGDDAGGSELKPGPYVRLSVSDDGCGIDPEAVDKIFDPYFTTKEQGKGTGLGLSVVYGIVKEHGGGIRVSSRIGKGSAFRVHLPLSEKPAQEQAAEKAEVHPTGDERILLVDDEEAIVRLEARILERLGYRVTVCTGSIEALALCRSDPDAFDLVVTDMTMPGMTGSRMAEEMMAVRPDIPVIVCTGFSERMNKEKAEAMGIKGFLMKPVVKAEMAGTIRSVLDEARSGFRGAKQLPLRFTI